MRPTELDDMLSLAAQACDSAERPIDPAAAPELLRAANGLAAAVARLREAAAGECDAPDLDGLCMACGRKLAEPVRSAQHGCNPFSFAAAPAFRLRRLAVRVGRLGRLHVAAARSDR